MELRELQQLFYTAVFDKNSSQIQHLTQVVKAAQDLTSEDGIAIYRGSIFGTLSQTLQSIYPVCYCLVGEKFFAATATVYLHHHPSQSPDLGDYGAEFPEFLSNFKPAAQLPYLPDLARLEWHWHRVFHGDKATEFDSEGLSKIPPEKWGELVLSLPQNSVLLESVYPIHRIWEVNQPNYEGDESISLDEGGSQIFLWRQEYDMRIDLPTPSEWQLLKAFKAQDKLETICENLAHQNPPIDVSSLLPLFVQRGWIVNFSI